MMLLTGQAVMIKAEENLQVQTQARLAAVPEDSQGRAVPEDLAEAADSIPAHSLHHQALLRYREDIFMHLHQVTDSMQTVL